MRLSHQEAVKNPSQYRLVPIREIQAELIDYRKAIEHSPKIIFSSNIENRHQMYGAIEVDPDFNGEQRIVGFITAAFIDGKLRYSYDYLRCARRREEYLAKRMSSIYSMKGIISTSPIAFLYTVIRSEKHHKYYWTSIFTKYSSQLKIFTNELKRSSLHRNTILKDLIFS